jgi:hypothetical protein
MVIPAVIARDPMVPPAQDFDALKSEAIGLLQQLCAHWTDYNAHDPGVTLVELLSYALTDLGYRATLPVADLLASATLATQGGIYPPWRALPSPPVTIADFRRLLLDRVEGLANVWLTPRRDGADVDGLYDIRLHAKLPLPGVHPEPHPHYRDLLARARRVFRRNRPLCEDIGSIRVLRPLRTTVSADVAIDRGVRPEAVMAEALFRLALTLAPEPRRSGPDPAGPAIPEGPLLTNGWFAAGELTDKPATIDREALAEVLRDVPGVLRVSDARLWVEDHGWCDGTVQIDADCYCSLDAGIENDALPLVLSLDGRACAVDRGDVLRRLLRRWDAHRADHPLKAAYREAFILPEGRARALARFAPLGPQLPRVYGLAGIGKPESAAAAQLQGFLALFEAVMRSMCIRLDEVAALLGGTIPADLPARHREDLLDLLLALYGVPADRIPIPPRVAGSRQAATLHRVTIKQALLDHRATLARRRGRGFDPHARSRIRREAGAAFQANLLLGGSRGRHGRICLIEHMMLRPRTRARRELEQGRFTYAMAVSAGVAMRDEERHDPRYRAEIEAAIRDALPAHIALHVHFLDPARWRRLHDLNRLWHAALALDERHAADQLAAELRDLLERWSQRERMRE